MGRRWSHMITENELLQMHGRNCLLDASSLPGTTSTVLQHNSLKIPDIWKNILHDHMTTAIFQRTEALFYQKVEPPFFEKRKADDHEIIFDTDELQNMVFERF